jgi:hypothetical protein
MASTQAKKKVRRSGGTAHPAASKRKLLAPVHAAASLGSPTLRVVANPESLEGRIVALEKTVAGQRNEINRALGMLDQLVAAGARIVAEAAESSKTQAPLFDPSSTASAEASVDAGAQDLGGETA